MTIRFHLLNSEKTEIMTFNNLTSNPFKLNDVIYLTHEDLSPNAYKHLNENLKLKLFENNETNKQMFHLKQIELIKEKKYVRYNVIKEPELTIEYHCILIP